MKGTIKGTDLAKAVAAASQFTADKSTVPIFGFICLTMRDGVAHLYATNGESGLETEVPCAVSEPGRVAISGSTLSGMAREVGAADVEFATKAADGGGLTTVARVGGKRSITLPTLPAEEFPNLTDVPEAVALYFSGAALSGAIKATAFAAAKDRNRFQLSNIRLRLSEGEVSLAATDGHRMALSHVPVSRDIPSTGLEVILPTETLRTIRELVTGAAEVTLLAGDTLFAIQAPGLRATGRMIEGKYPAVERVLEEAMSGHNRYEVNVKELAEAARWASLTCDSETRALRLDFKGGTTLVVSARDTSVNGESEQTLDVTTQASAEDISIGINGNYLLEGLAQVQAPTATLVCGGLLKSLAIKAAGAPEYVVMTMRLGG